MLGSTLAKVLTILKSELGTNLTIGTADNTLYYQMIETQQEWLASMFDWDQLKDEWTANVVGGVAGRFVTIPTVDKNGNTQSINFDRPLQAYVMFSARWQEVGFGIGPEEFNVYDSENDPTATQDPIMKWKFKSGDNTKIEIWPLGTSASQTFRFEGQRKVNSLRTAGVLDATKTLDLDDRLVALSIAVDILTGKEDPAAKSKSDKLNFLWQTMRAAESKPNRSFPLGAGTDSTPARRVVPITVG